MVAFYCYDPSDDGTGGIHIWYMEQLPAVRSAIDAALEVLSHEVTLDENPAFKPLRGKCSGLAEIKIDFPTPNKNSNNDKKKKSAQTHVRLLGPHEPPTVEFVLLTGFLKKGGPDYGPACHQAHNRHRGIQRDASRAKPCRFP
jgi:hypothetical protein